MASFRQGGAFRHLSPGTFMNFFRRQIEITRIYGIPVRIDYRWFVVFALSVWLVATLFERGVSTTRGTQVGALAAWLLGAVTTAALFLSVFGHELSHALAARFEGIETEEIVLHPFGGLARLSREPETPRAEFRIAVAGPASSFLFSLLAFAAMAVAVLGSYFITASVFFIIGLWNLLIAVFNILPGYPLDGGRILRAWLWGRGKPLDEATRTVSLGGQLIGWTLIVFGVYFAIAWGDLFMGVWTALVGFFLRDAAANVVREMGGATAKARGTVAAAMSAPFAIEPDTLLSHFVDNILPMRQQIAFPVARGAQLHGVLSLEDLRPIPRDRWRATRARDVMRPVNPDLFVRDSSPLADAMSLIERNGAGALAVVNARGELVGFLQRGRLRKQTPN